MNPDGAAMDARAADRAPCGDPGCECAGIGPEAPVHEQMPGDGVPEPMMAGTFAVYELPGGAAGLVLDIRGSVSRHHVPKMVVDMVLHGKKPSVSTVMGMFKGGK